MKLRTKIIGWLFVAIGFMPLWLAVLTGGSHSFGNATTSGAITWFFGIGGIGVLLRKSWGWWLATIGAGCFITGGVASIWKGPSWGIGLLGFFGVLAFLALCTDNPWCWAKGKTDQLDRVEEGEKAAMKLSTKAVGYLWLCLGVFGLVFMVASSWHKLGDLNFDFFFSMGLLCLMFGLPSIKLLQQQQSGWWAILLLSALWLVYVPLLLLPAYLVDPKLGDLVAIGACCIVLACIIIMLLTDRPAHWTKRKNVELDQTEEIR